MDPENEEAVDVFFICRHQVIIAGKILDIKIEAVKAAMDIFRVQNQKECFERVRKLSREFPPGEEE